MKQVVSTKMEAAMYNPVSQATVVKNGMLYSAGMIGRSPEAGKMHSTFEAQARQALRDLGVLLSEAGRIYREVMFVQVYLLDMSQIEQFTKLFKEFFSVEPSARAVCQPQQRYPGAQVMFTTVAYVA